MVYIVLGIGISITTGINRKLVFKAGEKYGFTTKHDYLWHYGQ
jgi:hypothetical protein